MTIIVNDAYVRQMSKGPETADSTTPANNRFLIYQGTMPTNLTNWVEADNSSDLLVTFNNFSFDNPTNTPRTVLVSSPSPSVVNAVKTGTAAWYAYVNGTVVTRYFFGTVTLVPGDGSLTMDSLSLVLGNPATFVNWSIEFTTT